MKKNLERKSQIIITDKELAKIEIGFGAGISVGGLFFKDNIINLTYFCTGIGIYLIGGLTYLHYKISSKKEDIKYND